MAELDNAHADAYVATSHRYLPKADSEHSSRYLSVFLSLQLNADPLVFLLALCVERKCIFPFLELGATLELHAVITASLRDTNRAYRNLYRLRVC